MTTYNTTSPFDPLRRLCRRLVRVPYGAYAYRRLHRLREPLLRRRRFQTDPQVFHPTCFLSTEIFIDYLLSRELKEKRLLDMGTGSGALGIFAAAAGADVIACDINPHAVELARRNAAANGVAMNVHHSDLFTALENDRFDLICFNIPFYPKPATTLFEHALNAGSNFETVRRFARDAHAHLLDRGRVVIIFSEDSGVDRIIGIFEEEGWQTAKHARRQKNFELFHIVEFIIHNS